ncbi:hypothetical protein [Actinophytocola oryzae]|uniref:Uncharacterized protein n=1 Tax=Actinophytocola oryzae TaxID=502181 RepID=A0A4V3FTD7_9PSEU|nr:hypothetical protein [Actinophytocola oryzae]TDV50921.1 hypothetical protein CLV71_106267 [Actinophytocola oryzae]
MPYLATRVFCRAATSQRPSSFTSTYNAFMAWSAAGWSEADKVSVSGGSETIRGGRGKLPVTEEQLATIATGFKVRLG